MVRPLEADAVFLHVAGGAARNTPPPGVLATPAPRRSARARSGDLLFVCTAVSASRPVPPGLADQLAHSVEDGYFGTPGSVTSGLRAAADEMNQVLVRRNRAEGEPGPFQGSLVAAVLRDQDFYIAQCGAGQAAVIRPGTLTRLTSEEAADRPLGLTSSAYVRYHHLEVRSSDLVVISAGHPSLWSDAMLSGLAGLALEQASDRLLVTTTHDLAGVLIRLVPPGAETHGVPIAEVRPRPGPERVQPAPERKRPELPPHPGAARPSPLRGLLEPVAGRLMSWGSRIAGALSKIVGRLAPGLVESAGPGAFPPSLLAATAVAVPLVVVAVASVMYFRRGRGEQFDGYLAQAQAAVAAAQAKGYTAEALGDWEFAQQWIDLAQDYGDSRELDLLRDHVQQALDGINLIVRLEFRPVLGGGFGSKAEITALAATATDLYILDQHNEAILHTWATGRGYELDTNFECLSGARSLEGMGTPVDIVTQPEPGALGKEGVVAIDGDGTLLYCAADAVPVAGQLAAPDTGWGKVQAIDVYSERLYVLDSVANAVWLYDATGGLFSGSPSLYFAEQVPDLKTATDLTVAEGELLILHNDGRLNRCRRSVDTDESGVARVRVECEQEPRFQDERPGHESSGHIPGAMPIEVTYTPPPEPSIFFLDSMSGGVFHYSLRLVYQAQYLPLEAFEAKVSAQAIGPPNDLFIAAGGQVYRAELRR